jgi:hypothetical protein
VFKELGYADLAQSLGLPLINLHSGALVEVQVPKAFVFPTVTLHRSLTDIDLLCSVPMMKTHALAQVTLGIKNLVGVFPGTVYQSVRGAMHDAAAKVEPSGTAAAIVDMLRANKLGLVVVDGSMAMEGNGPTEGTLLKMDLIVAGANPVATDMVASSPPRCPPSPGPTRPVWGPRHSRKSKSAARSRKLCAASSSNRRSTPGTASGTSGVRKRSKMSVPRVPIVSFGAARVSKRLAGIYKLLPNAP